METLTQAIGRNIRRKRREHNLTEKQLGEMIDMGKNTVGKWELGVCAPSAYALEQLSIVFKCTVDDLFRRRGAV